MARLPGRRLREKAQGADGALLREAERTAARTAAWARANPDWPVAPPLARPARFAVHGVRRRREDAVRELAAAGENDTHAKRTRLRKIITQLYLSELLLLSSHRARNGSRAASDRLRTRFRTELRVRRSLQAADGRMSTQPRRACSVFTPRRCRVETLDDAARLALEARLTESFEAAHASRECPQFLKGFRGRAHELGALASEVVRQRQRPAPPVLLETACAAAAAQLPRLAIDRVEIDASLERIFPQAHASLTGKKRNIGAIGLGVKLGKQEARAALESDMHERSYKTQELRRAPGHLQVIINKERHCFAAMASFKDDDAFVDAIRWVAVRIHDLPKDLFDTPEESRAARNRDKQVAAWDVAHLNIRGAAGNSAAGLPERNARMMRNQLTVARFLLSPAVTLIRERCSALLARHFPVAWRTNVELHRRRFTEPWISDNERARYVHDKVLTPEEAARLRDLGGFVFFPFASLVINRPGGGGNGSGNGSDQFKPVFLDPHCDTDDAGSLLCLVLPTSPTSFKGTPLCLRADGHPRHGKYYGGLKAKLYGEVGDVMILRSGLIPHWNEKSCRGSRSRGSLVAYLGHGLFDWDYRLTEAAGTPFRARDGVVTNTRMQAWIEEYATGGWQRRAEGTAIIAGIKMRTEAQFRALRLTCFEPFARSVSEQRRVDQESRAQAETRAV